MNSFWSDYDPIRQDNLTTIVLSSYLQGQTGIVFITKITKQYQKAKGTMLQMLYNILFMSWCMHKKSSASILCEMYSWKV